MNEKIKAKALPDAATLTIDPKHYYRQDVVGYYEFPCPLEDGTMRSAKLYLAENSIYTQPTVFLLPPSGTDAWEFLEESGWKDLAEKENLYLVVLEPENGAWKTDETEYIGSMVKYINTRPFFAAFASKFYGVAYGDGADCLGRYSRRYAKSFAGVALLGTTGMSQEEKIFLETTDSPVKGVRLSQIQMPVWAVAAEETAAVSRMLEYYRKADHSQEKAEKTAWADQVYRPDPAGSGSLDEDWCADVIFSVGSWKDCVSEEFSETLYRHLFKGTGRYTGNANGALRHDGDMEERGFRFFSEMVPGGFREDQTDLYERQWWVYVPDTVEPGKKVPAVFMFHGAGGFGIEIGDRSGWARVAEKHGFILICPCASHDNKVRKAGHMTLSNIHRTRWNSGGPTESVPGELEFMDWLYRWVLDHYPVDETRVYASGQSSGGMMAWACACYRPDYFAAAAPFSATTPDIMAKEMVPPVEGSPIAVMANMGLADKIFEGGFSTDSARKLVEYWSRRYRLDHDWSDFQFGRDGRTATFKDGKFNNYVFRTADGVPMLRCVETETKTHAVLPSECEMAWTQFFAKFTKDVKNGILYYEGRPVK